MDSINGTETDLLSIPPRFSAINYAVFGSMLAMSACIGVYFGFISKKKQDNTVEYLLGGKSMNFFPIAASLIASHISGSTFLAVPAEVYAFGAEYMLTSISIVLVSDKNKHFFNKNSLNLEQLGLAMIYVYLPVFYDLQLTSSFQYLEKRFNRKIRLFSSMIYIVSSTLFVPIVM